MSMTRTKFRVPYSDSEMVIHGLIAFNIDINLNPQGTIPAGCALCGYSFLQATY